MLYHLNFTKQFKKGLKLSKKRGYDLDLLEKVLSILENEGRLPLEYHPHKLEGKYNDCWECHIKSDWLLIWKQYDEELVILVIDTGTHSDLFK